MEGTSRSRSDKSAESSSIKSRAMPCNQILDANPFYAFTSLGLLAAGRALPGFGTVGELCEQRSKSLQWIWSWCVSGQKAFGRHANAVFKMTMATTTIEDRDLGNEDWGPVKASEEVWRIRSRTWDPHLSFTFAKL